MKRTCLLLTVLVFCSFIASAQQVLSGVVKDKSNVPLLGVNVIIKGTAEGVATDFDGKFVIETEKSLPLTLTISYLGYITQEVSVNDSSEINVVLEEDAQLLNEVVVSTSRKSERVIDAPASVSVINAKIFETKPIENAAKALTQLVGVDVAEDNIGQYSVTLRGDRFPFGNTTLIMVDNRNIKLPGFDYSDFTRLPVLTEDFERIEVTRGPASALYGPGVSSGVIQYTTKSPIKYPGTTVVVGGGGNSTLQVGAKHAVKVNDNFGFKLTAKYFSANAWEYDANNPQDAAHLALNNTIIRNGVTGETIVELDPNNPINNKIESFGISGNMEYQKNGHLLNFNVGYANGRSPFYIDRGDGYWDFSSIYSQVRYSKGGLFIQYDNNFINAPEGNVISFKSGETTVSKNASHEFQAQYNFDAFNDRLNISLGGEYRLEVFDTERTINGIFEDDDDFDIAGAYLYTDYSVIKDKLNFKATGRVDNFIAMDVTEFSPQLALVYKPAPTHSFRASWSRVAIPPPSVDFFGDVTVVSPSADSPFFVNFLGGSALYNYDNATTDTFIPNGDGFLSFDGTDFPLQIAYQIALGELAGSGQVPQPLIDFLATKVPNIQGGSAPVFLNPLTGNPLAPEVALANKVNKSRPTLTQNYELGYKGYFGSKLSIDISSYWGKNDRINMQVTNPLSLFANISTDLTAAATGAISDAEFAALGSQLGISGAEAEGLIASLFTEVGNGLQSQPLGLVAHSIANKFDGVAELHLSSVSEDVDEALVWGGLEIGANYRISNKLSSFINYNFVNNDFNNTRLVNTGLLPRNRVKLGFDYTQEKGWSFGASMRYQDPYTANFQDGYRFSGVAPSYTVYDANVGYAFNNGMTLSVSGQNLLNSGRYRAFPFTPKIGTLVLAKLVYNFGGNK